MKHVLLALLALCGAALAAPVERLDNFELTDQHANPRSYRFPKAKVTVMTVAGHKGSEQIASWVQRLNDRYRKRIDIDGIADVSMIAVPFRGMFRRAFKKRLAYSVMLDWEGAVVRQFGYQKGVVNLYVIDRRGRIVKQFIGPVNDRAMLELTHEIDRAVAAPSNKNEDRNQ